MPKRQHSVVSAAIRQASIQRDQIIAVDRWRWPKLATLRDESAADVLAKMAIPDRHRTKLHSTNPLARLHKAVLRRADAVGIFRNRELILRLIGAVLFAQNDDWQNQHRSLLVEAFSQIDTARIDPLPSIATQAAAPMIRNDHRQRPPA